MRFDRVLLLLPVAAVVAACGPSTNPTPSSPASSPSSAQSSSAASTAACNVPGDTHTASVGGKPSDQVLTTDHLPSGGETWTQVSDQQLGGSSGAWQRGWQNADNSKRVEVDVALDSSGTQAAADWAGWCRTIQGKFSATSNPSCPSNVSTPCVAGVGTTSGNKSEAVYTWQSGAILVAALVINASGPVDQTYAASVASAEDAWILAGI